MAYNTKLFAVFILFACSYSAMARPLVTTSASSLKSRLKLEDDSTNCWDSLMQLQACSGEVILFFLNGETYLGRSCCEAIRVITEQCWPNLIDTLGFTTEEGDILEGYCGNSTTTNGKFEATSVPSRPSVFSVGDTVLDTSLVP